MKTLPREPWRGGQICGEQLEYGLVPGRMVFCGERKESGSYWCRRHHDDEARMAAGNVLGEESEPLELLWEPFEGAEPVKPTAEELLEHGYVEELFIGMFELQVGDVVLEYGMRVLLEGEPDVYKPGWDLSGPTREVRAWTGRILNLKEILKSGSIPPGYLAETKWVAGKGWTSEITGTWRVQGSENRRLLVERRR